MLDRRGFIGGAAGLLAAGTAMAAARPRAVVDELLERAADGQTPEAAARDEDYWAVVQAGFMVDRSVVNLNNGGVSPSPRIAHEALKRRLDEHNSMPTSHTLWSVQHPRIETVRQRLAQGWGVDAE